MNPNIHSGEMLEDKRNFILTLVHLCLIERPEDKKVMEERCQSIVLTSHQNSPIHDHLRSNSLLSNNFSNLILL